MENDKFSEILPGNFAQPSIYELINLETLKKMGKLSKEATIQKALSKAKFIREGDVPSYDYDCSEPYTRPIPTSTTLYAYGEGLCPADLPYCLLGCVCSSIGSTDMYDDCYEKHCRDTGDPDCMYGCICDRPGPHLNGESKWITSKAYKYKRPRVRDDEDCGFVPVHMREQMKEGRPKRKAQAPTRYRPDFSISEKEMRAYENGGSNGNGFSKLTSRPRRRLCEEDDDDAVSDDSDERIIRDNKRKVNAERHRDYGMDISSPPKKGRPPKQQAYKNLREPSKRERKRKILDIPETEPRRRLAKIEITNGVSSSPAETEASNISEELQEVKTASLVSLGRKMHVIYIQPPSKTCQGMNAILRPTSEIISFISWDDGFNLRPYLQDLEFKFTSNRHNHEYMKEGNDLLFLPYVKTQDTMWIFYGMKRNFTNWDTIVCPELHAVIQGDLLLEIFEKHHAVAIKSKISIVMDISYLNMNKPRDECCRGRYLCLFLGKNGDVFFFGTPPPIYSERNMKEPHLITNALIRLHQRVQHNRRARLPKPLMTKVENTSDLNSEYGMTPSVNSYDVLAHLELEYGEENSVEKELETKTPILVLPNTPELTTPEVLPPSPVPDEMLGNHVKMEGTTH